MMRYGAAALIAAVLTGWALRQDDQLAFMAAAGVGHWYGLFIDTPLIGRYRTGADAVETMKLLMAAGARTDGRTGTVTLGFQRPLISGLTPAHGAAFQGWSEVIEFLHEQGLDINAKQTSPDGMTPRDVALAESKPETAALIERLVAEEAALAATTSENGKIGAAQ